MQPNIAMKFTRYMAYILICKYCEFGEKNLLHFQKYRIFPKGLLFGAPCTLWPKLKRPSRKFAIGLAMALNLRPLSKRILPTNQ